ncbi:MAG TPA: hypothetical protein VIJ12_03115 [Candidatus Baltobacteraceae bacterium]
MGIARQLFVCALLLLLASSNALASPDDGTVLGRAYRVSAPDTARYEMMWARPDPKDPRYIMVCGMYEDPLANRVGGYLYASFDGGRAWARRATDASTDWVSEEHCAYGSGGDAYFTTSASNTDSGEPRHEYGNFHLFVSRDHGLTWRRTITRGFVDWTFASVLPSTETDPERLIIFGNQAVTKPGQWGKLSPVVFESTDGGLSLKGPFAVPAPSKFSYQGEFAFGTASLPDGTVLFSTASRHMPNKPRGGAAPSMWKATADAEIFAFSLKARTLRSFSIVHSGESTWSVPLARDDGDGPFRGRLYLGWIEAVGSHARAVLATSDDNGATWSSHEILRGSSLDSAASCAVGPAIIGLHLTVNGSGVLGASWIDEGQGDYFAASLDGGKTFTPGVEVARYPLESSTAYYSKFLQAVAIDEYSAAVQGFLKKSTSLLKLASLPGLGISLRVDLLGYADASDLVADANGGFHAFWAQPGIEGQALWTRGIVVQPGATVAAPVISRPAANASARCEAPKLPIAISYPRPNAGRDTTLLNGWKDMSSSLALELSNLEYSPATHDVALDVRIINRGVKPLRGSLAMTASDIHSDFGNPEPLDAERTFRNGATWFVSPVVLSSGTPAGGRSAPFRLRFRIRGFHEVQPQSITDAVAMGIKVYKRLSP